MCLQGCQDQVIHCHILYNVIPSNTLQLIDNILYYTCRLLANVLYYTFHTSNVKQKNTKKYMTLDEWFVSVAEMKKPN